MRIFDYFRLYPELKTVIVNLKTGNAFRGVIWRRRGPFVVLKNARLLQSDGNRPLDGEVIVQMADIEFIQVV